jgi:uncharacterized protein (TIGR02270 family)
MEPLWDLVQESLEEAAFLWKRWEADLLSLTRNLSEVGSWTEDRLQGALDGVRVARQADAPRGVVGLTRPAIEGEDPGQLTICAHLLSAGCGPEAVAGLADVVREAVGPRLWSMIRGIEAAELDATFAPVRAVLSTSGPEHLAALCRLKAFRRSLPGDEIAEAFSSGEPRVQVEALRVLRHSKDDSAGKYVTAGLKSDSTPVRKAAIECGVRQRQASAWETARKLVHERNPEAEPFLSLLACVGSPEDGQLVIAALREPALQRSGLFALAYIGTPEAVEICLTAMRDPKLARGAGEVYCAITGADLQRDHLTAPEPDEAGDSLPALDADDLDADLVPAPIELWPLPDESRVRGHWEAIASRYARGVRHFLGKPVNLDVLVGAIESGPMLRRPDLITELSIRSGGRYDVEPRAFAHVQRRMMAASRGGLR